MAELVIYADGDVEADPAPVTFEAYLGECCGALTMLEFQGRVPPGTAEAVRADAFAREQGRPKALIAQLTPDSQHWVRFAEQEMRERPREVGGYGQGVPRPVDL